MRKELQVTRLSDYQKPPYLIPEISLDMKITPGAMGEPVAVSVNSELKVVPNPDCSEWPADLTLDAKNLTVRGVKINRRDLKPDEYIQGEKTVILKSVPKEPFTVEFVNQLHPEENSDLFGFYITPEGRGVSALVKSETIGFSRVTPCSDRPDNPAKMSITIHANKRQFPVLLSNGDKVSESLDEKTGVATVVWRHEKPKPTYLFSMAAGDFERVTSEFLSEKGNKVALEFYVPRGRTKECEVALETLRQAMAWDEKTFELYYTMLVHRSAVFTNYASGASETDLMFLFSASKSLATLASRTDTNILDVMETVAHETFHTWSGNNVTVRDWFNLTLKEGLTDYRAWMFMVSLFGEDLVRAITGKVLTDDAPRPDTYVGVRSLYTAAAYGKSAEIFKMIKNELGEEEFHSRISKFLSGHQGQAKTLEELLTFIDKDDYLPWFIETGTPHLNVTCQHDPDKQTCEVVVEVKDRKDKPILFSLCLFDKNGQPLGKEQNIMITEDRTVVPFDTIQERPIPSLLRRFSAPVTVEYPYTVEENMTLMAHDTDVFNRKEAARRLVIHWLKEYYQKGAVAFPESLAEMYTKLFEDNTLEPWLLADILSFPTQSELLFIVDKVDFERLSQAMAFVKGSIVKASGAAIQARWDVINQGDEQRATPEKFDKVEAGNRRLKNVCLSYLLTQDLQKAQDLARSQFKKYLKTNMTYTVEALRILYNIDGDEGLTYLKAFTAQWLANPSSMEYLYSIVGGAMRQDTVERVKSMFASNNDWHFDSSSPSAIYALLGSFCTNPYGLHYRAENGYFPGYLFMNDVIQTLDKFNAPVAVNVLNRAFSQWTKFDDSRKETMRKILSGLGSKVESDEVKAALQELLKLGKPLTSMATNPNSSFTVLTNEGEPQRPSVVSTL